MRILARIAAIFCVTWFVGLVSALEYSYIHDLIPHRYFWYVVIGQEAVNVIGFIFVCAQFVKLTSAKLWCI